MASQRGVRWTTFDNIEELDKIKAHSPQMQLLLRVFAQDEGAKCCPESGASDALVFATVVRQAKVHIRPRQSSRFQNVRTRGFQDSNFETMAATLRAVLAQEFPGPDTTVNEEPGRLYTSSAHTMACKVIARRK
ncbi:hypothetical protein BBP40_006942 [Aspergillus hancockii]|nr:hypothetical protein BBP40_006942 [Aspergillus hancockii]